MNTLQRRGRTTARRVTAAAALTVGGLASCADGGEGTAGLGTDTPPSAASETDLAVTGTDRVRFEPDALTFPAGRDITLTFSAERGVEHDFVIEDAAPGDEDGDIHVVHVAPGETSTATFRIAEPGTYTAYCSVPGHRQSGMVATLTAEDPG